MSGSAQKVNLNLTVKRVKKTILSSFGSPTTIEPNNFSVEPFGAWIGMIE